MEDKIRYEIESALIRIGIPSRLIGYDYLVTAISKVIIDRGMVRAITRGIYGEIAAENGISVSRVERAIRRLIEVMYERCDIDELEKYVGRSDARTGKLTNGVFIANFARTIYYKVGRDEE